MKKIFLFLLTAGITLYACKKDKDNQETPGVQIDPADAKALTAAVKVFHGTNITGAIPLTPVTEAPVLAASSNNQTIMAISGRYAVIIPEVASGEVSGYYVQITGADSYFKVDYSKPVSGRKKPRTSSGLSRITGSNADSAIVIVLPANIKPGTFCLEYAAYDAENRLSNFIKACVTVIAAGTDESGTAILGSWRLSREQRDGEWRDPYKADSSFNQYACSADTLAACSPNFTNCISVAQYINQVVTSEVTFADNGRFESYFSEKYMYLSLARTPCNNPSYITNDENWTDAGGWSYNATTKKLTVVYDYDDGEPNYDVLIIPVVELSSTKLVLENEPDERSEYVRK
ncbi:hypothetical protein [uncultured Chitinophaga sp.]|jgi:hypothetical protein|uniref:hypothetical protein n=1 Tax=uncultured Chitinophaga sp. TaxID=339340 RepID=UPI0026275ADA|nr:hypothetical protein [uncultured Chitinophaga sp.]